MSLNQFRVNQPNVADGILRQTRNMRVKEGRGGKENERKRLALITVAIFEMRFRHAVTLLSLPLPCPPAWLFIHTRLLL